jgi:hypothetical protein
MANQLKDAHPTSKGWVHPRTGELLKAQKMTEAQIAAWWAAKHEDAAPAPAPAPAPQTLHEAPSVERELSESEVTHHYGIEEHSEHEE